MSPKPELDAGAAGAVGLAWPPGARSTPPASLDSHFGPNFADEDRDCWMHLGIVKFFKFMRSASHGRPRGRGGGCRAAVCGLGLRRWAASQCVTARRRCMNFYAHTSTLSAHIDSGAVCIKFMQKKGQTPEV